MATSPFFRSGNERPAAPTWEWEPRVRATGGLGFLGLGLVLSTDARAAQAPVEHATSAHAHRRERELHLALPACPPATRACGACEEWSAMGGGPSSTTCRGICIGVRFAGEPALQ